MAARSTMRFLLKHAAIVATVALSVAADSCAFADEPIEIFDSHLHYNWEPKPFYQLDEVLALFKKHRITGILATSRPNTGTHALMDANQLRHGIHHIYDRLKRNKAFVRKQMSGLLALNIDANEGIGARIMKGSALELWQLQILLSLF